MGFVLAIAEDQVPSTKAPGTDDTHRQATLLLSGYDEATLSALAQELPAPGSLALPGVTPTKAPGLYRQALVLG